MLLPKIYFLGYEKDDQPRCEEFPSGLKFTNEVGRTKLSKTETPDRENSPDLKEMAKRKASSRVLFGSGYIFSDVKDDVENRDYDNRDDRTEQRSTPHYVIV